MESEFAFQHLLEGAKTLNPDRHVTRLLKSHYLNICRTVLKGRLGQNVSSQMCKYCSSYWSETDFKLKLLPHSKLAQNSKSRNLIANLESDESKKTKLLTPKQKRRAKWLRKKANTQLEIHCGFCAHKTRQPLEKRKKVTIPKTSAETVVENKEQEQVKTKKKKKKPKDKTAGLKIEAIKTSKKPTLDVKTETHLEIKKPSKPTTIDKPKVNIHQPIKTKKPNKAAKTPQISKTQQGNKLLQLAQLLKKQTKKNTNTSESRLQALMK